MASFLFISGVSHSGAIGAKAHTSITRSGYIERKKKQSYIRITILGRASSLYRIAICLYRRSKKTYRMDTVNGAIRGTPLTVAATQTWPWETIYCKILIPFHRFSEKNYS